MDFLRSLNDVPEPQQPAVGTGYCSIFSAQKCLKCTGFNMPSKM